MQEVTAIDAAKLTGHSEKTIRRWIVSGKLPARQVSKNRYAIKTSDLRKYIPDAAQPDLGVALARIQELESTQDTLLERIDRLEALVTLLSNGHRPDKKVSEPKPLKVKQRVLIDGDEDNQDDNQAMQQSEQQMLPEGTIIMAQFARDNGLNRRTVQDWIMQGKVEATTIEGKHYLTPDQQQAIITYKHRQKQANVL
jgi:excisionase family DNA binding protein